VRDTAGMPAVMAALLTALAAQGIVIDSTTAS
jgi:hypothetical protein